MALTKLREAYRTARGLWDAEAGAEQLDAALTALRSRTPAPTLWLLGKTQSGKTSLVKYFTNSDAAEIGRGFRPTTKTTREYPYPAEEAPVVTFLDTRGLGEPGYDPAVDIAHCTDRAHIIIVTLKLTDAAQSEILDIVQAAKRSRPDLPVVAAVTCLHEAYPGRQHPEPDFSAAPATAQQLFQKHQQTWQGIADAVVPIDLTQPEEGYEDQHYGGPALRETILQHLPAAYRVALQRTVALAEELKDLHLKHAIPIISGYASLAATAGAIPIPFADLVLLPAIQTRMVYHLARLSGRPLEGSAFLELAASMGLGLLARQAIREAVKIIPFVGSAAAATLAAASTYALGRAFVLYYQQVHDGHVPDPDRLKHCYANELARAERFWKTES
jgi:uncharacterized protein (DUF697 family)/predicted GTPase